ncbi:ribonuclease R [Gemmatimonadota bacterium]
MLKERIIRHLKEAGRPKRARDIRYELKIRGREHGIFTSLIKELTREGKIRRIEGNWYVHPSWVKDAPDSDDPGYEVTMIVRDAGLPESFPEAVEAEAREVSRGDFIETGPERIDLRDRLVFTIDPAEARDFDDAVSIEVHDDGWTLGVHIADVSHFVRPGSKLDAEAWTRSTSVYLVDRVIPMLPEELSNNICSLRPGEDRLTFSCFIRLDGKGKPVGTELTDSVINSRARLTYEQAQQSLDGEDNLDPLIARDLAEMGRLARILMKNRENRGALDLDLPEPSVKLDEQGNISELKAYPRHLSHRLVEEFMILANEAVASWAGNLGLPFIYRVHDEPEREQLDDFRHFLVALSLPLPKGSRMTPAALNEALHRVKGTPVEPLVSRALLRHLKQAEYRVENSGHFGLASRAYAHFTSPIRRYPDLVAHRLLRRYRVDVPTGEELEELEEWLADTAERSGEQERVAMDAERDSIRLKQVAYLESFVGDTFDGLVTAVTEFGLFVELKGLFVDGLIHISELSDDYFRFEPDQYRLTGQRSGRQFRLGQELQVQLVRADRVKRHVDLIPFVEETEEKGSKRNGARQ